MGSGGIKALPVVLRELESPEYFLEEDVIELSDGLVTRLLLVLEDHGHLDRVRGHRVGEVELGLVRGQCLWEVELYAVKDLGK